VSSHARHRQLLHLVATDSTFERRIIRGETLWVGRCIFCQRALTLSESGEPRSTLSIEHIIPRHHGGTDELENLALACKGCNNEKGMRHDLRDKRDPRLAEIIATLQARRRTRWRDPASVGLDHLLHNPWRDR
jgi:5-methylcytosine-specific restriction endonuclease McrA